MAVTFSQKWADQSAGTIGAWADRYLWATFSETKGAAVEWYWTADGTDGTTRFVTDVVPFVVVLMASPYQSGAWGLSIPWGPAAPSADVPLASLQYFWRSEYDASALKWYSQVYTGGADADQAVIGSGTGRRFFAFVLAGA